jgi:acetyltransferase
MPRRAVPPARLLRMRHGERVVLRPIRAGDAAALQAYIRGLSTLSRYYRFFAPIPELPPSEMHRVLHLDGMRQAALIACAFPNGTAIVVGEARHALAPNRECEFALSVAEDWRRRGLALMMLAEIECRARSLGARSLVADVLHANEPMKSFAAKAGFSLSGVPSDAKLIRIAKDLATSNALLPCTEPVTSAVAEAA